MSTTTKRNKTEKLKKTLLVTIATINVLNNIAPLAVPGVKLIAEATKQTQVANKAPELAYQLIENGGQLLDSLLFSKAEAFTDPVTTYVQSETVENGTQRITSGGTAVSITIDNLGIQNVSNGGTTIDNVVNISGRQNVSSGGLALHTVINSRGTQNISSGGVVSNTTINSAGVQFIANDAIANATTVNTAGIQILLSGGIANDTVINSGGSQNISAATANNTVINPNGSQFIYSGGTATSNAISSKGNQFVFLGGTAISTTISAGGSQNIAAGAIANVTIVNSNAIQFLFSGAQTNDTTINNGGSQYVATNARANSVTINSGGAQVLSRGGTALNVVQSSGGKIITDIDGSNKITLLSGSNDNGAFYFSDGVADNFILYSGVTQDVLKGGTANNTTINNGAKQTVRNSNTVVNSTTINGGEQHSFDSAVLNNTTINGGSQVVGRDTTANSTTINSDGLQIVSTGAIADITTVNDHGVQKIAGGVANNTTINSGGTQSAVNGGSAISAIINTGGVQDLVLGAIANNTTINGGIQNLTERATANNTAVNGGGLQIIDSSTTANATIVNDGGSQIIRDHGVANDTIVNSGGLQIAFDGARTINTTINSAGQMNIHNSVVVDGTLTNAGLVVLNGFNNGIINNLTGNRGTLAFNTPDSTATYDKKLNIVSLSGSQTFEISADLLNNKADSLIIGGARGSHYIRVTKEASPSGNLLKLNGTATVVKLLNGGDATFQGVKSNIEGVVIEPQLKLNGNLWQLTGYVKMGASDLSKVALSAANMTYASLYAGENNIKRRLGDVRNNLSDAGVWLRTYGGQYSVDRDNLKYVMVQGGYDKVNKVQDGHTLTGITVDHLSGNTAYAAGLSDGKTRNTRLGLYHAWLGDSGQYYDITLRTGRMNNKVNTHETDKISGSYSTWNTGVSAEYGYKKELKNGAYITPQAELFIGRINAAKYTASDGTAINQHVLNSMLVRLGLSIGKKTDRTDVYFTTSLMHEFAAKNSVTTGTGDFSSKLERDLRGTSVETSFGGSFKSGKNGLFYTEATRSFGGKIINKWQLQAGYRLGF